jgi:16S rRNA G966 N2-methylase RsmD
VDAWQATDVTNGIASRQWLNKLYYGDNLHVLREHIADDSVDLVYLDPPFNSDRSYNVLFKEKSGEGGPGTDRSV